MCLGLKGVLVCLECGVRLALGVLRLLPMCDYFMRVRCSFYAYYFTFNQTPSACSKRDKRSRYSFQKTYLGALELELVSANSHGLDLFPMWTAPNSQLISTWGSLRNLEELKGLLGQQPSKRIDMTVDVKFILYKPKKNFLLKEACIGD